MEITSILVLTCILLGIVIIIFDAVIKNNPTYKFNKGVKTTTTPLCCPCTTHKSD